MMKLSKADYTQLEELEQRFREEIQVRSPQILADIPVSRAEVEELGGLIGNLLRHRNFHELRVDYPLCTSLFLVWCTVYHYREGNLWEPIFARLNVQGGARQRKFLGDLFLATLSHHRLQLAPADHGKRYMTPLLMHGYISDYYANRLLDYLNAIYTSYLQYDVTDQALDGLWSDLFNLSEEQSKISDTINELVAEEQRLRQAVAGLQVPDHLKKNTRQTIEELQTEMQKEMESIADYEEHLVHVGAQIQELEALFLEFRECETALVALDELVMVDGVGAVEGIGELSSQVASVFIEQLAKLRESEKDLFRGLKSSQNRYAITKDKRVSLMTEVVKLGQGSMVVGYSILEEYQELKARLDRVIKQRKQRESLLSYDQELGNTSARQILTASLTTLGLVNPALFQEFIKTTLRMLDQICAGRSIRQEHRMTEPIQKWYSAQERRAQIRRTEESSQALPRRESASDQASSRRTRSALRVSRIRLKSPSLVFDEDKRQLILVIPEQNLRMPVSSTSTPQIDYAVDYGDREECLTVDWQVHNNQLFLSALDVPVISPSLRGLRFRWFNLFEDWPLELHEVMVFNENGQLQSKKQLSNGFYHIIAHSGWQTDCDFLVDCYPCNVPDYLVYEVQLVESRIQFFSPSGEEIVVSTSRYSGISLQEVRYIPGFTQAGIPVAKGSPRLVINKALLETDEPRMVLEFHHNGGLLHKQNFRQIVEQFGEELTPQTMYLDLERLAPVCRRRPNWETFAVQVKDFQGNIVFEHALCMVRRLSISHGAGEVQVEVPKRSILHHPKAEREGRTYLIPADGAPEVGVRVFFPRTGWKDFAIEVPGGITELISPDGEVMAGPLAILPSQSQLLEDLTVKFRAHSELVRRVRVTDSEEHLSLAFNLSRGSVEIPLRYFADLCAGLEKESTIALEWEGELGSRGIVPLVDVFPRIDVDEVEIFESEQVDEYILELSFVTEFPVLKALRFRLRPEDSEQVLFDRRIRSNPDHFYLQKSELKSLTLQAEIYYIEEVTSVFGTETLEQVCWSGNLQLSNRKALLQRAISEGIMLKTFKYDGRCYPLPRAYPIVGISISAQHFEGEELLRGHVQLENGFQEVFFYLDTEKRIIPYLRDADYDGVQYDPSEGRLFWEMHSGADIMGPLDDVEFVFMGEDE